MAEPALTLRDHPQIIDLISVLEQSGLQKQKEEVQALVGYIDGTATSSLPFPPASIPEPTGGWWLSPSCWRNKGGPARGRR